MPEGNKLDLNIGFNPTQVSHPNYNLPTGSRGYFGNTGFGESQYDIPNTSWESMTPESIEKLRADRQGWGSELANAIGGGLAKLPFTVIGNVGSMLDFEDYVNTDKEVGNWLTTWAEEVKGDIEGATKIYQSGDDHLTSREWWMNNIKGLIDSAGAFVVTGGALGKGIQLLSNLTKGSQIINGIGTVTNAAMLNQAESIPIAMGVYKDAIDLGKSEQEAADAAAYSIAINRINIPLNLTSAGAFLRPVPLTRQVAKDVSKKEVIGKLLSEGAQEYSEENINMIAENEAKLKARQCNDYTYNFDRTVSDVLSKEGFEQGIVGFLGGVIQTGGTDLLKSFQKDSTSYDEDGNVKFDLNGQPVLVTPHQSQKERFKAQQKSLNTIELMSKGQGVNTVKETLDKVKTTATLLNDIQEAAINGDEPTVKNLQNKLLTNQALDAFKNGTTEQLINVYKSIQQDPTSKEKYGEDYMSRSQEAIKTIEDLEKTYIQYQQLPQVNEIFNNRAEAAYTIKEAQTLKQNILNAQADQLKEIEVTGFTKPEQIETLASTKELKGLNDRMKMLQDKAISLTNDLITLTSADYTTNKIKEKQEEPAIKEKQVDNAFGVTEETKKVDIPNTKGITVQSLAEKMINRQSGEQFTPAESQFYENNKDAVEDYIAQKQASETQQGDNEEFDVDNRPPSPEDIQDLSEFVSETPTETTDVVTPVINEKTSSTNTSNDIVSDAINDPSNSPDSHQTADEQITQNPVEKQKGFFSDISHGMSRMANVVMMKLFNNYWKEGQFKFERTKNGLPEVNEQSLVDIEELNNLRVDDTVTFELVTLEGKALQDYNDSKEESLKAINTNISNYSNIYNYPTNDKNHGFDDKHIAIKSNNKIIGYVQQPHAISNSIISGKEATADYQKMIDARNTILAQRKAIISRLEAGQVVSTKVKTKGSGNLYTKLKSDGRIDPVNEVLSNFREKDQTPSGNLIFVYNDGKKLDLPKMDDVDMEDEIKLHLAKLGNWGKVGSVYQLVKDTNNEWYPIPVYANTMTPNTISELVKALKGLTNKSEAADVIKTLNPFVYSTFDITKKNAAIILDDRSGNMQLTIDGISYLIDDLNRGIGLADFKQSLSTKRQNIEILNINGYYMQEQLAKRNTLVSNALTYKGEYLVQPFVEYEPITQSKEVQEYKEAPKKVEEQLNGDETSKAANLFDKADEILKKKLAKGEKDEDYGFKQSKIGNTTINKPHFEAWLKHNLPGLTISDINDLGSLKANITDAIGAYRNMVIYLFNGAQKSTGYHEAFHGVFRDMLSYEQRFALIEEAITKYPAPTEGDLIDLQKTLKGTYNNEELTYLYYEEKLADSFGEYMESLDDTKVNKSLGQKILDFFKKILNMFDVFTMNNQYKIDELFDAISTGKLAKESLVNKKKNIQLVNRELSGNNFGDLAFARNSKFNATYKWERTKSIGDAFMVKYNELLSQGKKNTEIFKGQIFDEILGQYIDAIQDEKLLDAMTPSEIRNLQNLIKRFAFFKKEATKYLENYNIKFSKSETIVEAEQNYEKSDDQTENNDEEVTTLASQTTKGLGDWVSQAGLKSASVRIKMFVSSIPLINEDGTIMKDKYGFTKYHEFNNIYYLLERSLTGINTFEEMVSEMNKLAKLRPELYTVIDRLTKPSTYTNAEELVKLQNDFKSNFTKQQLSYSLVKFDTNSDTGDVSYRIFDANRQSVKNMIEDDWTNNLINPDRKTIVEHSEEGIKYTGTKEATRLLDQWKGLKGQLEVGKAKQDPINRLLLKLGIELSPDVLTTLISKGAGSELISTISDILQYHNTAEPDAKTQEAYRNAITKLVDIQASGVILSYTQSFNNVENSNIYTIQLPSFASKLMDDLTARNPAKFKARLAELQKDPLYKHSNILDFLQKDNDFRTTKFRLNYLDGLKDEKGSSKGSKFTNMSPKDYMAMQIALFQNRYASSAGQIAKAKTNKYIYVTPSDKSMCMIFDGTSYNAKLNDEQKIDVTTPIVNNFYNVLLQEASRIKQQLEIKAKVLSGELDKDGKDLLVHYHHKPKSDRLAFDGFAYQIMQFGDEFNSKFNKIITELIQTTENVEEALLPIEQDIKKEIAALLNKEYQATLNEAVEKGIIREVEGKKIPDYQNIALDSKSTKSIRQQIADFSLNTWLNNIEMSNLLNGDIALYKANDLQKRTYQSQAMGVNINIQDKPIAKTKVVKDFEIVSDLEHLKGLVPDSTLESYTKNNVTDAQVLVHPDFYKAIFVGRGTWTNEMQTAFDIAEGIIENPTVEQLEQAHLQLSNIKPFYFGNRFDDKLGIQRFEQVKCAMLPLFKSYNKMNPLMAEKRAEMDTQGLDMIAFESSFKAAIGYKEGIESSGGNILDLDMNNFMIQVDNPAHVVDEENDSIRQLKMLFIGNIDPNKSYNGKSGKDIIQEINDIEGTNIQEDLGNLLKLINGKKQGKFKEYLKEMLTKRNATENMMEALSIVNDEFKYALDGGPTSTQMENLISSLFTNKVIKQKFEGGSGVQASSLGVRYKGGNPTLDKMRSDLKYMTEIDGKMWSEAIMPAWTKEFFGADGKIKGDIPDSLKELLMYRIPTEGYHSMMAIKVKGFLPEEYGNTILMPYEVTTQFGADFDFDKVYFLRPEFEKNEKGELVKVQYDPKKPIKEQSRGARNNRILDHYLHILTSKEILPLIMNPSGFEYLAKIKADIDKKDNITPSKGSFFSSRTQRDYKARNHVGMGLKGQLALHVTGHSYATLLDLNIKGDGISLNGITETNLSKLYSFDGKLISKSVSSMMAAILDDIKNPIIQALGVNEFTADSWATIVRAGFDEKTAVNLITQPAIVELSAKLAENNYKIKVKDAVRHSVDTLIDDYNNRYNDLYKKLTPEEQKSLDIFNEEFEGLTDVNMEKWRNFKATYPKTYKDAYNSAKTDWTNIELGKYYAFQGKVLESYANIDKIAKDLVKINRLFGVNKEVGPNMEDIINKKYLMNEIEEQGFSISGLNSTTINTIKSLDQSYKTHEAALNYLSKYFPYDSISYKDVKYSLIDKQLKVLGREESLSKIPVEKRMLINGFIRNFIDHSYSGFISTNSQSTKETLYKEVPKLIDDIKNTANDEKYFNGALRKNVFIETLDVKYDDKNKGLAYITVKANRLDVQHKNNISEAIYSLYKNPATKHIIEDLVTYSFNATGFFRGLKSFHDLIPPVVLEEMGYSEYRKTVTNSLQLGQYQLSPEQTERLVDQMVRNFPSEFAKVFDAKTFQKSKNDNLYTNLNLAKQSGRLKEIVLNWDKLEDGELPVYVGYIRVYDNKAKKSILYKNNGMGIYQPISKLGKPGHGIEIDVNDDIEHSIFSENNLDNKSILTTFADETNTSEETPKPALETEEYSYDDNMQDFSDLGFDKPMTDPEETERLLNEEFEKPSKEDLDNENWTNDTNDCGI